jgi:ABC-type polysaccharide/polyol phosphate transport system ATPase subunit
MAPVIEFQNVSKRFRAGVSAEGGARRSARAWLSGLWHRRASESAAFWALRDVSFGIDAGESFALIGHNGSGKSTSLKLITRILEPTSGSVRVNGRVAALLELGSGFHPDLSGRENIYLNGALLGFSRRDMRRRIDEIVSFAELEHFIDLEVKHYSSGMFMRLGFAIATAVDPDVLITDEVLAVGDEAFQRKCMERIFQFRRQGKTIVLVSHALEQVRSLCQRAIWLDHGEAKALGPTGDVIGEYLRHTNALEQQRQAADNADGAELAELPEQDPNRWGSREAEIVGVELIGPSGHESSLLYTDEPITVRMRYRAPRPIERPQFGIAIHHAVGLHISGPNNTHAGFEIPRIEGEGYVEWHLDRLPLLEGSYLLSAALVDATGLHIYDYHNQRWPFVVRAPMPGGTFGLVRMPGVWKHTTSN